MLNDAPELSEQELRKIADDIRGKCLQMMWFDREKARNLLQKEYDLRFQLWKKAAEKGIPEGQWFVGACYQYGAGVTEDAKEAVGWYQKAAAQGHAAGQDSLANCLYDGIGIEKNEAEAVKWYRAAADQGFAEAQRNLGVCFDNGYGVPEDAKEAVSWYQKAAAQGYPEAQNSLAECLYDGTGIEKNEAEAVKWYRAAADQGLAEAQWSLGICYRDGFGVTEDDKEAVRWYQKAAVQGNPWAQNSLANCLFVGKGIAKNEDEAVKWYRAAADQDDAHAQNRLGLLYEKGKLVPKDKVKAVSWYRKAADQDLPVAQYNLAMSYEYGRGVSKDLTIAAEWYRKSAENGFDAAQYRLGCFHLDGKGVAHDEAEGIKWLQKAAEQRYAHATRRLNKLCAAIPEVPEHETQNERPDQEVPVPQEKNTPPVAEESEDKQTADSGVISELTVVQCVCGKLMSPPFSVKGGECECPSCHASIKIPPGPNPKTYLISDIFPDRKEDTPRRIYISAKPAIATIVTDGGTGSGFFVTSDGLIITNNHVVDGCDSVIVKQSDAAAIRGRVIRSFLRLDLAFIKIHTPRRTPFVRLALPSQANVGDVAYAIGSPHEFEGTFTEGVISSKDRVITGCHYIQTDAPISPGNSGGPLLNAYGEAVGVNTMFWNQSQNINFAIPASVVRDCLYEVVCSRCVDKKYCVICGHASADTSYCDNCGVKLKSVDDNAQQSVGKGPQVNGQQNQKVCGVCGAKLASTARYCLRCGASSSKGEP
ncbi:MAG: SEL1-like repeat protein [Lentisphaerae bacterium]|nr:SEL1-like repeat protein [Lentisphaerota bacterium]